MVELNFSLTITNTIELKIQILVQSGSQGVQVRKVTQSDVTMAQRDFTPDIHFLIFLISAIIPTNFHCNQ